MREPSFRDDDARRKIRNGKNIGRDGDIKQVSIYDRDFLDLAFGCVGFIRVMGDNRVAGSVLLPADSPRVIFIDRPRVIIPSRGCDDES